ncbi:MAG: metalloregulator ArsR/SmtB family transcription factor [Armatimonadetes bacterium]|nr:metalloregulator ArsR/SmtB family transcription factor [Armatimonadota bacterium]
MEKVYRAIADPTRRAVLKLLRDREMTAGELAEHFELTKPTLSKHFAVLREAGLVSDHKSGRHVTYRLEPELLERALVSLMEDYQFVWAPPIDVELAARQFVESLVRGDFDALNQDLDDEVKSALTPEKLREHWQFVVEKYGPFVKQTGVRTENYWKFTNAIVACEFGRSPLSIKVVFGRSGLISGLWFMEEE